MTTIREIREWCGLQSMVGPETPAGMIRHLLTRIDRDREKMAALMAQNKRLEEHIVSDHEEWEITQSRLAITSDKLKRAESDRHDLELRLATAQGLIQTPGWSGM